MEYMPTTWLQQLICTCGSVVQLPSSSFSSFIIFSYK